MYLIHVYTCTNYQLPTTNYQLHTATCGEKPIVKSMEKHKLTLPVDCDTLHETLKASLCEQHERSSHSDRKIGTL